VGGSVVRRTPPMDFPLRVIVALVVISAFAGVGVWGVVAVLQAKRLTNSQRMIGIGGIAVIMALLTAWVFFVWPAGRDHSPFTPRGA
jgi:CHASE2 domain-containing sensor protein